ncbi:MAG: transcriptional antiterminator RfaH [Alphaproteobacteria bacterium]|jgi:transcriptional antiterminator RfaH|nr:transcriptional antiterminator RfaH [Alphaproteobacteria bacterium]
MTTISHTGEGVRQEDLQDHSVALAGGERWYVVRTLPMCEGRAQLQLKNQNFRTFLPKRHKTIRHARRMSTVEAAFFPSYLFVALDLARHQWRSVNGTFGVASLVMRGDQPHPVPRGVVETLIASTDARGILQLGQHLKVGGSIRLAAGPFAEHLAILDRMDDSGRIRVLLGILGRQVAVSTHRDNALPAA